MPEQIESPDMSGLKELCKEYMDFLFSDAWYEDNDYKEYIFEKVIETFYGRDIFKEINKRFK